MPRPKKSDALTALQVAELAGISVPSLARARVRGSAPDPDFHEGRSPRWWPKTIDAWLEKRARGRMPEVKIRARSSTTLPVGLSDIADKLGVSPATAHQWFSTGRLPEPRWSVSGRPCWAWEDVEQWAKATGRLAPDV